MADIILFGTGQISDVIHFYIENDTDHKVVGFTMDKIYIESPEHKGLPVVPFEELEKFFPTDKVKLLFPISYKNVNKLRKDKYMDAKKRGYDFISYISSKATYYGTPVGENTVIFEDNTIQPFVEIGNNVIMWSGNHIGHHSKIKDGCFITSHVVISGSVIVGEQSFIGVNTAVHDNIKIGRECVIGAGAIVAKDLEDYSILRPARSTLHDKKSHELTGF